MNVELGPDLWADEFPRSNAYSPQWLRAAVSGGANPLWLTEWLTSAVQLQPGMRVLDLGCGRAASSVFLHEEFGVDVVAADLWFSPTENHRRIHDAGADAHVVPLRADARSLPFADGWFDAILSVDSFVYYGTDDLYLADLARFLRPGGTLAVTGAGLVHELTEVPTALEDWWQPDLWCLHSAQWWRHHWQRTGIVTVDVADIMPDGWRRWLDWQLAVSPTNVVEIDAVRADQGRTLGYVRVVATRTALELDPPVTAVETDYETHPHRRGPVTADPCRGHPGGNGS